jgi:predicted dehydrogenase
VVATPTHLHRELVLAALQAGRHVYCEAPLPASIEDARAIATAALGARSVFQGGMQGRANALYRHVA